MARSDASGDDEEEQHSPTEPAASALETVHQE